MRKIITSGFILVLILGNVFSLYADRGHKRKANSRIDMNINLSSGYKRALNNNSNSGLVHNGVICSGINNEKINAGYVINTYQKGNNVYLQKVKARSFSL